MSIQQQCYHSLVKHRTYWLLFVVILVIAAFIRSYRLGVVPHGMTWDEAAIGYNGYALLKTRRDEWLVRLPVSFRSFGDYKAPLAIYINGIFTYFFGMNLLAVRLPFAVASLMTIAGFMLLVRELFKKYPSNFSTEWISLFAGLMMTLSPWHIHYSRAGFESGIALMFVVWGVWFFWKYVVAGSEWKNATWLFLATGSLVASLYTYHSSKIVAPLLLLTLAMWFRKELWQRRVQVLLAMLMGGVLLYPLVKDSISGSGLQRLDTSVLNNLTGLDLVFTIIKQFLIHLSPSFLAQGATTSLRHGGGGWGVLLPSTFVFAIAGLVLWLFHLFGKRRKLVGRSVPLFLFSVLWIVIGLLPAAIGEEIPHSNRALLALPGFLLLALLGIINVCSLFEKSEFNEKVEGTHHEGDQVLKAVVGTVVLVHCLLGVTFLKYYFSDFAKLSADAFKDGYIEAFQFTKENESNVEKIVFTSDYGQPYIYALFVKKTNPIWYQGGSLNMYEFTDKIDIGDLSRQKTIVVASESDDIPIERANKVVYGSDGSVRFKIYTLNTHE